MSSINVVGARHVAMPDVRFKVVGGRLPIEGTRFEAPQNVPSNQVITLAQTRESMSLNTQTSQVKMEDTKAALAFLKFENLGYTVGNETIHPNGGAYANRIGSRSYPIAQNSINLVFDRLEKTQFQSGETPISQIANKTIRAIKANFSTSIIAENRTAYDLALKFEPYVPATTIQPKTGDALKNDSTHPDAARLLTVDLPDDGSKRGFVFKFGAWDTFATRLMQHILDSPDLSNQLFSKP